MPSVSAVLSGAASFGVLAGVLTGVCYVLLAGLQWASRLRLSLPAAAKPAPVAAQKACARCGRHLSALPLGPSRRLQCAHCHLPVCRRCCAQASNARWLCDPCRKLRDVRLQSGEWFYDQLRQRFRSTVATLDNANKKDGEVQEFIEKLVEAMIGGCLDDVAIYPISDTPEYSVAQDGDTASDLHCELKELMKQIIHEAMNQPKLKDGNGQAGWPPPNGGDSPNSLGQRSYEDILATAILNKVFAKYQQCRRRRSHRNNEKAFDKNSNILSEKLSSKMQDRSESEDSDSAANSLDSWSESSHQDPLSITIEECIEEVTTRYSSDDNEEPASDIEKFLSSLKYIKRQRAPFPELGKDIVDGGLTSSDDGEEVPDDADAHRGETDNLSSGVEQQVNPVDSWEENWLFQRRRLKTNMGTCQPVPVPMLVPNPSEEVRAMIGDVDADEMSDLSDCSDSVLEDLVDGPDDKKYFESQLEDESEEEKSNNLIDKQREVFLQYVSEDLNKLIKGDTSARGISPDTGQGETVLRTVEALQPEAETAVKSPEETDSCHSYSVAEARNLIVPTVQVDSGEGSLDMQQDSEYTVAYATLAQVRPSSVEPSPSPSPSPSPVPMPRSVQTNNGPSLVLVEDKPKEEQNPIIDLSLPPKPGTIAEREHLKWEKAPPLANNPYSKENIARRQRQRMYLSRHSSSENSIEFPELTGTKEPSLLEIDSKHRRDDYNKYVRDYYVNVAEGREVSSVAFEEEVLKGGMLQAALRVRGASPQFKMNPLYEETKDSFEEPAVSKTVSQRSSRCESGYASSLDSLVSGERLAPPSVPEVVERTFLTLPRLRKEVTGSLRLKPRRSRDKFGGSLRLNKSAQADFHW